MAQLKIQQVVDMIFQHLRAGRVREAESLCRTVLTQLPSNVDALYLLGMICCQTGRHAEAIPLLRQVLTQKPGHPESLNLLAQALQATNQLDDAIASYREALRNKPDLVPAHYGLAHALYAKRELDEAIAAFRQTVALMPRFPEAHFHLADALHDKGDVDAAIATYRQAIALKPSYPEAHNNLGNALHQGARLDEAIAAYRQAIALKPIFPEAYNNLGNALNEAQHLDDAVAAYRQAIAQKPDFAEAHSNLGRVLKDQNHLEEAIAACRLAIALKPDLAEAHSNLSRALKDNHHVDEAYAAVQQALALNPNLAEALLNLGNLLKDGGRVSEAITVFRRAFALKPATDVHSTLIFTMHFDPNYDADAIAKELRLWNQLHAEPLRKHIRPHPNDRNPERRLRIGYVSPDFRAHVIGLNIEPLLANHDHNSYEIFAYADVLAPDALTGQLRAGTDHWIPIVGQSDQQIADQIRNDQIDILVDLSLHTANNRLTLFARKPAPVQVTFAGYPGSTGVAAIDYRLTDPYLEPPGSDGPNDSERPIRLPHSFWCYSPTGGRDLEVKPLPSLASGIFTFGCLNNVCKVNPFILGLWARVLRQVDNSRLQLLVPDGQHRQIMLDHLKKEGIEPTRVEFLLPRSRGAYLELYNNIDLGLDGYPYNGHTTSLDSYWMGVPVVTLVGPWPVSRAGWSQLSNLRLTELAATTPEQFVRIAVDLARDVPRLQDLRSTLRARLQASPLRDGIGFARGIEAAYRQMWRKYCATV